MNATAESVAGLLFHGSRSAQQSAPANAMRELHQLLADDLLQLEIHAWIDDGGPDGEQLYCIADLVSRRLMGDAELTRKAQTIVTRDDAAVAALNELARHCAEAGYAGAANWCLSAAAALQPAAPIRRSLSSIGVQRRGAFEPSARNRFE